MSVVRVMTFVRAPRGRVFDLARSVDLHVASTRQTEERAVAGRTSGLVALGDEVTWEARHFWVRQRLTVKITELDFPSHFQDVMVRGVFASMTHDHYFVERNNGTLMSDRFEFTAPLGLLGNLVEKPLLLPYLRRFLQRRNAMIKVIAEGGEWEKFVKREAERP